MRVAQVCADPGVPVFGTKGASVHVQAVAAALARAGARVDLLATRVGGNPPAALADVGLHQLPAAPKGDAAEREEQALANNAALTAALDRLGAVDLVYERYSLWSHAGMEFAQHAGVPGVLEVNAPLIEEQIRHRSLVNRLAAEAVAARCFAAATAIVAVSEGVRDALEQWPEALGKVHVIPNGVDPERFPATTRHDGPFTVGFLGTLKPWHGLETLVSAFARLHARRPGCRLVVVGDGPEAAWLEEAVALRGLGDAVLRTGAVQPDEVPWHLSAMDVAVAPYPDLRPFYFSPLKVVEYQAAGLPVVCSDVGGLDQLVEDGVTGVLCPPDDPAALALALEALADDRPLRVRMGRAARERVLARHTWDAVVARALAAAQLEPVA
jgi:glycosyltransferase involved in cell wall biosynthesis